MDTNPYAAPAARPISHSPNRIIQWMLTGLLIVTTLITGTPLVLFAGTYLHYRMTNPPAPPGDPDIGFGILMLLLVLNLPVVLAWIVWGIWFVVRRR